jgi:hypothetical protein
MTRQGVEAAVAQRQNEGLKRLLAEAEKGPLVEKGDVLVVVHERMVQEVISSVLPVEQVIAGRYRVRLTEAAVNFEDGLALVRLKGRASLADQDEQYASAELDVAGGLDVVDLDPRNGRLRGQVRIIAVDAQAVDVMGVKTPRQAESLVEDLGRERLEAFSALLAGIEIPVRIQQDVAIPAVSEAGVRIGAASVPLAVAVLDVNAFRGRLWVSVKAAVQGAAP